MDLFSGADRKLRGEAWQLLLLSAEVPEAAGKQRDEALSLMHCTPRVRNEEAEQLQPGHSSREGRVVPSRSVLGRLSSVLCGNLPVPAALGHRMAAVLRICVCRHT
jgi:hypothetical protein